MAILVQLTCSFVKQGNQYYSLTEHIDKEYIGNKKQSLNRPEFCM